MELRVCHTCRTVRPGETLCPGCSGALTLADAGLFLGQTFGKYRIEAVLGAGGMGVVYRATHVPLQRSVALKLVVPHVADDTFERRFLREARVLAELRHPHIVEIFDFDVSPWGLPYYVMEHLLGRTLREVIEASGRGVSLAGLRALVDGVTAGLSFAHRKGVVHRDLKPDNVFVANVDARPTPKLLDFGIAKLMVREREATTTLTAAGTIVGTPLYLAPEQILGTEVDARADQYALALIVAEALCGRAVRAGKTLMQIVATDAQRPADLSALPPDVPAPLRAALARATQPDPGARFPDVTAFVAALDLPAADPTALVPLVPEGRALAADLPTLEVTADLGADPTPPVAASAPSPAPVRASAVRTVGTVDAPPPASPARRPAWIALLAGAVALALFVAWPRARPSGPIVEASPAVSRSPALPQLRRALPAPPDVSRLLALDAGSLVMAGGDALYVQRLDAEQAPTRIALGAGQRLVDRAEGGAVWLTDGGRLLRLDPRSQAKSLWATLPRPAPDAGDWHVAPTGRYAARVEAGHVAVCEVGAGACRARLRLPLAAGPSPRVRLGDAYLAVAQGGAALDVYRLPDGRRVRRAPLREAQVHDLALLDDARLLAVGGWFPYVEVFDLGSDAPPTRIERRGPATRLAWIADGPSLWIAGPSGAQLWSASGGLRDVRDGRARAANAHDDLLVAPGGLALLLGDEQRVALFDYEGLAPVRRATLGPGMIWALQAEPSSGRVFAGSSAGALYAWDPAAGRAESFDLHADGITDLALSGDALASTSDDKTLAVWRLPRLNVTWRSRAHDYLVNQLALAGDPPALWTASSDGLVKRWGWPQPDEQEALDTRRLVPGARWAPHGLWAAPDGRRVLVGTWQHALLDLRRSPGGVWSGRRVPVEARVVYRALALPTLDVVLFVGLEPARVWAYDLRRERLEQLPSAGLPVYTATEGDQPGEAFVVGEGALLRYRLRRAADGRLAGEVSSRLSTTLGVALSAARPGPQALVAGTGAGELVWFDTRGLEAAPLARLDESDRPSRDGAGRVP